MPRLRRWEWNSVSSCDSRFLFLVVLIGGLVSSPARAGDDATELPEASSDEPLAAEFSPELAARYLDESAGRWANSRKCAACHTIPPYLMVRPRLPARSPTERDIRVFVETIITDRLEAEPMLPRDGISAVGVQVAAALAINDRLTTGQLHPVTRAALDRMWMRQRDDGSWEWPFRDAPPIKIDEHYGVTFAALGAGMAPGDYARSEAARAGLTKIRQYLQAHPAVSLHQQAMLCWASIYVDGLLSPLERSQIVDRLMHAQRPDGGWALARLVENIVDGGPQAAAVSALRQSPGYGDEFLAYVGRDGAYPADLASDGYATGLVVFVARQAGIEADDSRIARAVAWLKSNQRASGRWFTHSLGPPHSLHYISNAGTAYALMALDSCGAWPRRGN